ncbi:hypothetical protein B0H63DRAFT_472911 [Podospora didyma]|uniref:Transaldolase n=1 Tax=Podospora didyma TaxID=330526 RepID=A0AAE0NQ00_9PEZI|nr:hypothetical protein B0H63DRAFT_472911 [Podospora didyma]
MATLLDQLRASHAIDVDTLDLKAAAKYGPFVDCTSSQATAFAELSKLDSNGKPVYQQLIMESIQTAHWMFSKQSDATLEELAVESVIVNLSLKLAPHISGYFHIQINPLRAYSTAKTVKNAERIVSHFKLLSPGFDASRVCINVPSTWEGLQACRNLETKGVATMATTVFCVEQAALAADAGCRYVDTNGAVLPAAAQRCLAARGTKRTQIMAASLTSSDEIMQLARGQHVHHFVVPPPLLNELAAAPAKTDPEATPVAGTGANDVDETRLAAVLQDEALWRTALTRSDGGKSETKQIEALNMLCNMQDSLEEMVRKLNVTLLQTT